MRIGAGNRHTQGHAATIGQHRPLDTQLPPIRRVFPSFFPRPREPWWWNRRDFATSIGCAGGRRTVATDTSRACGTHGVASTPESSGATNCPSQTPWGLLSIGSRFVGRRRSRRRLSAFPAVAARPAGNCDTWAGTTPCVPKGLREYANSDTSVQRTYGNPP
jgi:hypothetical protein